MASDSGFTRLLQDVRTTLPVWVFTGLPDGAYHLRVRAADAQDLEGREAATTLVLAARPSRRCRSRHRPVRRLRAVCRSCGPIRRVHLGTTCRWRATPRLPSR